MSKWPLVSLGNALRHRKEFTQIDDLESYKRCRVQLHAQGVVLRDQVLGAEIKTKKQQLCKAGEFLVAEIDAKLGGYGLVPAGLDGAIVSSHYFLFGIEDTRLDRRFLGYFIRTPAFRDQVTAQGSTNYAAIRPGHVLGYQMPLPPLAEQQRLVDQIDALAAKITEARSLREESRQEANALLKSATRGVFEQISVYDEVTLESVCTEIIDCLHSNPVYADTGLPTLRSPDVGWGTLNLDTALKTNEAEYRRRTVRGEPRPGDIIVVREGGGTGKAGMTEPGHRFSLGQRVMMLRPDTTKVEPRFLLYQWLSPLILEDQIVSRMKGSASPHLNIGAIRQFRLRLPSLSVQSQLVSHLHRIRERLHTLTTHQLNIGLEIDAILPAILDRAFTGKL